MEAIKGGKDPKAKEDKSKDAKGTVDKVKMAAAPEKPKPKEAAKVRQKSNIFTIKTNDSFTMFWGDMCFF